MSSSGNHFWSLLFLPHAQNSIQNTISNYCVCLVIFSIPSNFARAEHVPGGTSTNRISNTAIVFLGRSYIQDVSVHLRFALFAIHDCMPIFPTRPMLKRGLISEFIDEKNNFPYIFQFKNLFLSLVSQFLGIQFIFSQILCLFVLCIDQTFFFEENSKYTWQARSDSLAISKSKNINNCSKIQINNLS